MQRNRQRPHKTQHGCGLYCAMEETCSLYYSEDRTCCTQQPIGMNRPKKNMAIEGQALASVSACRRDHVGCDMHTPLRRSWLRCVAPARRSPN